MKNSNRRHRRRPDTPLCASLEDRLGPGFLRMPLTANVPPQAPRMPSPQRSTRDVLNLLLATTGLALAARPDAEIELLPGTPTTVIIACGGKIEAAFVLPVNQSEAARAMGQPEPNQSGNMAIMQLWQEEQQALTPEAALINAEETWLNGGNHEG